MTMDEVNERFPLTKYKSWVAARASKGLPTAGGVTAPTGAASNRNAEGAQPTSPTESKHFEDRPATAASTRETPEITASPATNVLGGTFGGSKKSTEGAEKAAEAQSAHMPPLTEVATAATAATAEGNKAEDEEDDEEDHIHDALPPELLTTPGDSCAICIDTIDEDDDIRGLTCGHAFHASCLDPWLTSRRACCPLCKADYYIPKPRPEGEAAEAERPRRSGRLAVPAPPGSAWTGIRGNRAMMFPGRGFMSTPLYPGDISNAQWGERRPRRPRYTADAEQAQPAEPAVAPPVAAVASNRLIYANPFRGLRFPTRSRNTSQPAAVPAPAQLEDVVIR